MQESGDNFCLYCKHYHAQGDCDPAYVAYLGEMNGVWRSVIDKIDKRSGDEPKKKGEKT